MTLKDVAKALGISVSMLSDIEQGRRKPFDQEKLERFCDFLGIGEEERALLYDMSAKETRKIRISAMESALEQTIREKQNREHEQEERRAFLENNRKQLATIKGSLSEIFYDTKYKEG